MRGAENATGRNFPSAADINHPARTADFPKDNWTLRRIPAGTTALTSRARRHDRSARIVMSPPSEKDSPTTCHLLSDIPSGNGRILSGILNGRSSPPRTSSNESPRTLAQSRTHRPEMLQRAAGGLAQGFLGHSGRREFLRREHPITKFTGQPMSAALRCAGCKVE